MLKWLFWKDLWRSIYRHHLLIDYGIYWFFKYKLLKMDCWTQNMIKKSIFVLNSCNMLFLIQKLSSCFYLSFIFLGTVSENLQKCVWKQSLKLAIALLCYQRYLNGLKISLNCCSRKIWLCLILTMCLCRFWQAMHCLKDLLINNEYYVFILSVYYLNFLHVVLLYYGFCDKVPKISGFNNFMSIWSL